MILDSFFEHAKSKFYSHLIFQENFEELMWNSVLNILMSKLSSPFYELNLGMGD
jgi:hypothetical protein